jgi:hypothetical protein
MKKKKRPQVNLILSHINHTFLILDLKPLGTLIRLEIFLIFFNVKERSNPILNLLQIGP